MGGPSSQTSTLRGRKGPTRLVDGKNHRRSSTPAAHLFARGWVGLLADPGSDRTCIDRERCINLEQRTEVQRGSGFAAEPLFEALMVSDTHVDGMSGGSPFKVSAQEFVRRA